MPEPQRVARIRHRDVLEVRLQRPDQRNAVDRDMALALEEAIDELESDPSLRAGVLTADGPVFCAGTDLKDARDKRTERGGEYGLLRRERSTPLIAAVDGPAVGGGFELVLACDLVVAGARASFSLPETLRGVVATGGGLFRASRSLPHHVAVELLLTGNALGAERAWAMGLVNELVTTGPVLEAALRLAGRVAAAGPIATAMTLTALRAVAAESEARGWTATADARTAVLGGQEQDEGRRAFVERRAPVWPAPTTGVRA